MNGKAIRTLAEDYFEAFASDYVSVREFDHARREVVKKCSFFPKVKDFLEIIRDFRNSPRYLEVPNQLALPEETSEHDITEEERLKNLERVENINKMLAGEMSMEDAIKAAEGPREFSGRLGKDDAATK